MALRMSLNVQSGYIYYTNNSKIIDDGNKLATVPHTWMWCI